MVDDGSGDDNSNDNVNNKAIEMREGETYKLDLMMNFNFGDCLSFILFFNSLSLLIFNLISSFQHTHQFF